MILYICETEKAFGIVDLGLNVVWTILWLSAAACGAHLVAATADWTPTMFNFAAVGYNLSEEESNKIAQVVGEVPITTEPSVTKYAGRKLLAGAARMMLSTDTTYSRSDLQVACAFAWLSWALWMASCWFSYKDLKSGQGYALRWIPADEEAVAARKAAALALATSKAGLHGTTADIRVASRSHSKSSMTSTSHHHYHQRHSMSYVQTPERSPHRSPSHSHSSSPQRSPTKSGMETGMRQSSQTSSHRQHRSKSERSHSRSPTKMDGQLPEMRNSANSHPPHDRHRSSEHKSSKQRSSEGSPKKDKGRSSKDASRRSNSSSPTKTRKPEIMPEVGSRRGGL